MRGKQAKILSDDNLEDVLLFAETSRHPLRNKVIVLLSAKSGLRAGEIAKLTWAMVTDPTGAIGTVLELPDHAAKKGSGRVIPLHEDLRTALTAWRAASHSAGPVTVSERGGPMTPQSIVVWFAHAYRVIGLTGCFFAFWAANVYHASCPARSSCWRVTARRSALGWPSVHSSNPTVHRRRFRRSAQARIDDLTQVRGARAPAANWTQDVPPLRLAYTADSRRISS
jgi:Phage integrase family